MPTGPSLPVGLLKELGVEKPQSAGSRSRARGRKHHAPTGGHKRRQTSGQGTAEAKLQSPGSRRPEGGSRGRAGRGDGPGSEESSVRRPPLSAVQASRGGLSRDDAQIAALEKKLGLGSRKSLPSSFHQDGLGDLLSGLDGLDDGQEAKAKRKSQGDDEWLERKRRKTDADRMSPGSPKSTTQYGNHRNANLAASNRRDSDNDTEDSDSDDVGDASSVDKGQDRRTGGQHREDPYTAPVEGGVTRYIPPAQRQVLETSDQTTLLLRRRTQGLLNKLTESNLLSILAGVEGLYREHARQHVTSTVVDLLLERTCTASPLPDAFLILDAAFATALYRVIGVDFGAHLVQATVGRLSALCRQSSPSDLAASSAPTKQSVNTLGFVAELYNLKMVSSTLIFDYIRLFLRDLTEPNTERLLRIVRVSGPQLRHDDPLALKDIVALIRPALSRTGSQDISARTRFMIDTINDLKDNKVKAGAGISALHAEHSTRVKKLLGALQARKLESTEPLRMGLDDIEQSEERGKWWLVGASWGGPGAADQDRGPAPADGPEEYHRGARPTHDDGILGTWGDDLADVSELERLAREQGMNTDVRRSIFVTLLSAADSRDAHARLLKLRLKKADKREVANVLVHGVGAEEKFNSYYGLVAHRACSDRKVQWAFQDCLWKLFRRLGEPVFGEDSDGTQDADEMIDLRRLANIARMYGFLVSSGSVELGVLKCLSLAYLLPKTQAFVEVLLLTVIRDCCSQKRKKGDLGDGGGEGRKGEAAAIRKTFASANGDPELARGLRFFLKKVVRKSKLVSEDEVKAISRACSVAERALERALDNDGADRASP